MNTAISESARAVLEQLGIADSRGALTVHSPIDGSLLGSAALDTSASLSRKIDLSAEAFKAWRVIPAPRRGELVRLFGEELRTHKQILGELVGALQSGDHVGGGTIREGGEGLSDLVLLGAEL